MFLNLYATLALGEQPSRRGSPGPTTRVAAEERQVDHYGSAEDGDHAVCCLR